MGVFGTKKEAPPPHPRREPRFAGPLTADAVAGVFDKCVDFNRRTLYLNNDPKRQVEMLFIAGQVRNERACDYVLRPLTQNQALREAPDMDAAFDLMLKGGLYSLVPAAARENCCFPQWHSRICSSIRRQERCCRLFTAILLHRNLSRNRKLKQR